MLPGRKPQPVLHTTHTVQCSPFMYRQTLQGPQQRWNTAQPSPTATPRPQVADSGTSTAMAAISGGNRTDLPVSAGQCVLRKPWHQPYGDDFIIPRLITSSAIWLIDGDVTATNSAIFTARSALNFVLSYFVIQPSLLQTMWENATSVGSKCCHIYSEKCLKLYSVIFCSSTIVFAENAIIGVSAANVAIFTVRSVYNFVLSHFVIQQSLSQRMREKANAAIFTLRSVQNVVLSYLLFNHCFCIECESSQSILKGARKSVQRM